jgi:hypothetical protein
MDTEKYTNEFQQFREQLYQNFNKRADTAMELVDALCSYPSASSPVELSLASVFRRSYTALYKAIAEAEWENVPLAQLVATYLPQPKRRSFWLLGVDVTSQPRQFALTLPDRGYVYQPNQVAGNKPVTIGHQYSTVAVLPEKETGVSSSWVVPLSTRRISTEEDKELVGAGQIKTLLEDQTLPFHGELIVEVGDTSYSKPAYLHANRDHGNLVTIARVRSNRTLYNQFVYEDGERPAHRPKRYGEAFKLPDTTTWREPDMEVTFTETSRRGKTYTVKVQGWRNMLMRGKNKPERIPMDQYPFTLVCITRYDEEGNPAFKRPLWLIVVGKRREELSLMDIYEAYDSRADLEHFFRFGKQKMLLTASQTPDTLREERWWQVVHIAYAMLWIARHLAQHLPRPWERHLPTTKRQEITPTLVRRDFERLIQQLGTPAQPPKPRGKSPGRPKGMRLPPRPRRKVVVKGKKQAQAA